MLVALTERTLKPGAYEDFIEAWDFEGDPPEGWTRAYTVRAIDDPNKVISFGFFDGTLEELRQSQQDHDYAAERRETDRFVESVGTDGIFEVTRELSATKV
jgi:hypothetical protein